MCVFVCVIVCACWGEGWWWCLSFIKAGRRAFYKRLPGYVPVCRQMSRSELRHSAQTQNSVSPKGTHTQTHTHTCVRAFSHRREIFGRLRTKKGLFRQNGKGGGGSEGMGLSMGGEKNLPAGSKTKYYVTAVQEVNVGRCPAPAKAQRFT